MMQPMFPPTDAVKQHKGRLQLLAIVHLVLVLTLLIMTSGNYGLTSLCTILCLFCATMNFNYCCVLIYIVYTLLDVITLLDPVGLYFQNTIVG